MGETEITGTLHYVTDYTGFSGEPEKQAGNYLALKVVTDPADAKVTVEFVGGQTTPGPIDLEPDDRSLVFRISDKEAQSIKVTASKGEETITKTYGLTGLTLEPQG